MRDPGDVQAPAVRDLVEAVPLAAQPAARGRRVISVIGVDHYARWPRLHNAVNDARAVEAAFLELGFETVAPSLFDAQATRAAIDDLFDALGRRLTSDDHLVVFFAGHGGTITRRTGAREVTTGYLIPVDGTHVDDRPGSLFELDALLLRISRFSALHILVILDACYAGLALAPSSILQRPRGGGPPSADPYERLHARASRILIASTLDNEQAQDGGALPGHSLFTACLLHALVRDMPRIDLGGGRSGVHASSLGVYVRDHVHLGQLGARQTPDFGRFGNDDRGDMPIVLDPAGGLRVAPRGSTPRLAYAGGTPRAAEEPALAAILPVSRARPIALAGLALAGLALGLAAVVGLVPRAPASIAAVLEPRELALAPERVTRAELAPPRPRALSGIRTAVAARAPAAVVARCPVDVRSSPKGAAIKRGDETLGTTPMHLELPCGQEIALSFDIADHRPTIRKFVPTPAGTEITTRLPRLTPRGAR